MTPRQIELVQSSFQKVAPIADKAAELFYDRLFSVSPDLRQLFPEDMAGQRQKLMATLDAAVNHLRHLDTLLPDIREMGRRHVRYGVTVPHYALVGGALIWTLQQALGAEFTPEMRAAWTEVYTTLASVMTEGAKS
jgi:hemoglobin-like flavoprotein